MKTIEKHQRQTEAIRRYTLIAPLLEEGLPVIEQKRRRFVMLETAAFSERTLRRWLLDFRKGGLEALEPKQRKDKGVCRAISSETLQLAEECRKELPRRSASLITEWLQKQGHDVARSTLERQLRQRGLSGRELNAQAKISNSRRFVRVGRNTLWQSDLKYGPYVPDPEKPGKKLRTYLLVLIDDATRVVTHAEFYANQKQPILEHGLLCAIQRYGSPKAIYVDNGKIFVSHWMKLACAKLNIRHLNARPFSPESKGKVERFNRTVESFLAEVSLINIKTLDELNELLRVWLFEAYQHKPHGSLNGKTPADTFANDTTPLRFHNPEALHDSFLWEAERTVDKCGCFSLNGVDFEAGMEYIRKKVEVRFDPFDLSNIQLWFHGKKINIIQPAQTAEFNNVLKVPPEKLEKPGQSKILKALAKENQQRYQQKLGAFRLSKEDNGNV